MGKEEGVMKCSDCGAVWRGSWSTDHEMTCPECQAPLEEVEER